MQGRMDYKSTFISKDQPPNIPNIITISSICLLVLADVSMPLAVQIKAALQLISVNFEV